MDPRDLRARYRTPVEVGWEKTVKLDHDFIGRAEVERELASPRRTIVTLAWNAEDVIDIYASLFRPGEEYQYLELPTAPNFRGILAHADHVEQGGRAVGVASGTIYSYHYRQVLSHCTMDRAAAAIGTEVVVKWGRHGGPIKDVRARVEVAMSTLYNDVEYYAAISIRLAELRELRQLVWISGRPHRKPTVHTMF